MTQELFKLACLHFLKLPYIWGGDDPIKGFDCSGLVQEFLAMLGLDPAGDQNAQALYNHFLTRARLTPKPTIGSLCFYGKSVSEITHVAMMLDGYTIIEAGGGGSKSIDASSAALMNAYTRLRPYNRRADLVAVVTPKDLPW